MSEFLTWILYDAGKVGSYHQALGVAEKLSTKIETYPIKVKEFWSYFPSQLWPLSSKIFMNPPVLIPSHLPQIIVSSGRRSGPLALSIKKKLEKKGHKVFCVHLMDPQANRKAFDLIISPSHDELNGINVIKTIGTIHHLTKERLEEASFKPSPGLKGPFLGVILGGDSRHYNYSTTDIDALMDHLKEWQTKTEGGILITPSRRTNPEIYHYLQSKLDGMPHYLWNFSDPNPYPKIYDLCDELIVTNDSISMMSEACFSGKTVYILELTIPKEKFSMLTSFLYEKGYAFPLKDFGKKSMTKGQNKILDETIRILPEIQSKISEFLKS